MRKTLALLMILHLVGCATEGTRELREPAGTETSPRLFIQPAPLFDMLCQQTPFAIDLNLQNQLRFELNQKISLFQSEWDKAAASIILESEKAAGRKFARKEFSLALSLCGWTPMGDPVLLVSALPYLGSVRTFKGFELPLNMSAFVSMTHHELLHSLVDNIVNAEFSATSALLEKYKTKPYNVLVHLHLMAIQKAAYQNLKNKALLEATDLLYAFIGGDYQTAWEIIRSEGTEKFLKELQTFNAKH